MSEQITRVKQSYARSIGPGIVDRFYDIFLKSHADVAPRFAKTDFAAHKELLKHGIHLAIMFAEKNQLGRAGIDRIRSSHARINLNVPPSLYPFWKRSFLQAVAETDPQFTEQLRKDWDAVLQLTIDHIAAGYDSPKK